MDYKGYKQVQQHREAGRLPTRYNNNSRPMQRPPMPQCRPPVPGRPVQRPPQPGMRPLTRSGSNIRYKKRLSRRHILFAVVFAGLSLIFLIACILIFVKPKLVLNGSSAIEVEVFEEFSDPGCEASFLFFNLTGKIESQKDPSTSKIGKYEKEYTLSCLGREYSISRTIHVVDKTPPKIHLSGETEMTLSSMDFFTEEGYVASDNYDGDLTSEVTISREYDESTSTCIITYTVKDSSENVFHAQRRISVQDVVAPELTLLGDAEMYTNAANFTDPGYSALDDLEGNLTDEVSVESNYMPRTEGDFTFTYSITDASGNVATAQRLVHVVDSTPPRLSLVGDQTVKIYVGETFTDPGVRASDDFDGDVSVKVVSQGEVDCSQAGTYTITYSVEDAAGNASQITRSVVVTAAPVILDVPYIDQRSRWPNGCESVCTVMALQYAGIDVSVDAFIDNYLDMSDLPYYDDSGKRWGCSPWEYFIGDPRESTGLCCYAPVIKNACDKFISAYGHSAQLVNGTTLDSLCRDYVNNGKPVIVWVTIDMETPYYNGKQWTVVGTDTVFRWKSPMHCMLLTGSDETYFYFNDPLSGKNVKYSKSKSEAAFQGMYSQAVVIS